MITVFINPTRASTNFTDVIAIAAVYPAEPRMRDIISRTRDIRDIITPNELWIFANVSAVKDVMNV